MSRAWDDATQNAAEVILHTVLQDEADEFLAWYQPEHWLGMHRAVGVFLRMKLEEARKAADA